MSSGGESDTLLDVFVAIRPDEKLLEAFNETINDTVRNTRTAFSSLQAQSDITAAKMKQMQSLVGQRPPAPPPAPAVEAGETAQNDRYKELRSRIREATDELQILQQTLRFTQADLKELGQSDLAAPFQSAVRTASALSLELRQIRPASAMDDQQFDQAEDSINSVISRIEDLRRTVAESRVGSQIQLQVVLNEEQAVGDVQAAIAAIEDEIKRKKIDISSLTRQSAGLLSPEGKADVVAISAEMKNFEVSAARAKAQLDGGAISARQFYEALQFVSVAADDVKSAITARLPITIDQQGTIQQVNAAIDYAEDEIKKRKIEISVLRPQVRGLFSQADESRVGALEEEVRKLELSANRAKDNLDGGIQSARRYQDALEQAALAAETVVTELKAISSTGAVQSGLSDRLRDAAESLRRLQQSAADTKRNLADIGQKDLGKPFEDLIYRAKNLSSDLRQIKITPDIDVTKTDTQIGQIESRIADLSAALTTAQFQAPIQVRVEVDKAEAVDKLRKEIADIDEEIKYKKVGINLTLPQVVGSAASEDRQRIYLLKAEIEKAQIAYESFKAKIDDTPESLERAKGALIGVSKATEALGAELNVIEDTRGKSFNSLSNSAYQLGQAFEDAAIGYQLNGITGAVRGASNNVAFLLNDLSRVPLIQRRLADSLGTTTKKVQDFLPLFAGVGAALAVTVLAPTIEWLQSLNDIDLKIRDISDQLQREFEATDFTVKINADERSFARAVSDLGSVEDVLRKVSEMQTEFADKTIQMQTTLEDLSRSAGQEELFQSLETILGQVNSQIDEFAAASQIAKEENLAFNEQADASLKFLARSIESVTYNITKAQEQAKQGIFDRDQLDTIRQNIANIRVELESLQISGGATDPAFAEKLNSSLEKVEGRFKSLSETASELNSIAGPRLAAAIEAAVAKTVELADKQALLRKQIEGSASEQSMFLLDVRDISRVYAELIDQTVEFYRSRGQDPTAIQEILRQQEIFASENRVLEQQKTLAEKLADAEDRLGKLREKNGESQSRRSRQLTLEAVSSSLQESVLSIESSSVKDNTDAINELTDEIASLNFEIARLDATRANLQTQFTDPAGFAARQRGISFAQPFAAVDFMASPFAAVNAAVRQIPSTSDVLSGPTITESVRLGIEQALEKVLPSLKAGQNGIRDAIKQQDTKSRVGQ